MENLLSRETTSRLARQKRKQEIKLPYAQDPYNMVKVKTKCHSECHEGVGGSRGVAPLILNFGTELNVQFTSAP
jgi:hypothetical protein